jgi:hypothetical protein
MEPNDAWIRRGTVYAPDDVFNFAVGRVILTNGQTSVSRVKMAPGTLYDEWYATSTTTWTSDIATKEVLVCEKLANPSTNPCDLWVRYNSDAAPTVNGLNVGTSAYKSAGNSSAWLARGFRDSWLVPGRVQITGLTGNIYVTFGDEWITNPVLPAGHGGRGEYLVLRDDCSCTFMEPQVASNHLGEVRTAEQLLQNAVWGRYDYVISKYTQPDGRVSIGKTFTPFYNSYYTTPSTGVQAAMVQTAPNALVCESTSDMSTKPTLNFGNKACGLWSRYKPNGNANWPATHGFKVGVDRNGNDAYVGRGDNGDIQWIGRVQITGTPGVYLSIGSEPLANVPEYLVVPNGCNCAFESFATGILKVGLVRSIDYTYQFAVGRKTLASGKIAITSVRTDFVGFNQWYANDAGIIVNDAAADVLVCETP